MTANRLEGIKAAAGSIFVISIIQGHGASYIFIRKPVVMNAQKKVCIKSIIMQLIFPEVSGFSTGREWIEY